jgi:hypothetical protein
VFGNCDAITVTPAFPSPLLFRHPCEGRGLDNRLSLLDSCLRRNDEELAPRFRGGDGKTELVDGLVGGIAIGKKNAMLADTDFAESPPSPFFEDPRHA